MRGKFQNYIDECTWLSEKGLLGGDGIYFAPGADAIPLMCKPQESNLSGLSNWVWDVPAMATFLESLGEKPIEHIGFYQGQAKNNPNIHVWDNYQHAVGDLKEHEEIQSALKSRKFDFIIFKGMYSSLFNNTTRYNRFERLLDYVHDKHTKSGTVILLARAGENSNPTDAGMSQFLLGKGYENLTTDRGYIDGNIRDIRRRYNDGEREIVLISEEPKTTGITSPELGSVGNNAISNFGDFKIMRRL